MKVCSNCGYERPLGDDASGIARPDECPRCGIIYEKAAPPDGVAARSRLSSPSSREKKKEDISTGKLLAGVLVALAIVVALPIGVKHYPAIKKAIFGDWLISCGPRSASAP